MFVFLFLLLYISFSLLIAQYSGNKNDRLFGAFAFIVLLLIAGLRDRTVGRDTDSYYLFYQWGSERMEPLFSLLRSFLRSIGAGAPLFILCAAGLAIIPFYIFVRRYSTSICFSALIYMSFSVMFYHQTFNTVRACIAIGFLLFFFESIESKRFCRALLFAILSAGFHYSSIVAILLTVLFCIIKRYNFWPVFALLCLSVIIGLTFKEGFASVAERVTFLDLFTGSDSAEYYSRYLQNLKETDLNLVGQLASLLPLSCFVVLLWDEKNSSSIYYKLFFAGVFLSNIFYSVLFIYRITMFFTILIVVILPNTFSRVNRNRKYALLGMSVFMVAWYIYELFTYVPYESLAGAVPYHFFWEKSLY